MEFKFIAVNEPDEEAVEEFHRIIAEGLVEKYGIETIRALLKYRNDKQAE